MKKLALISLFVTGLFFQFNLMYAQKNDTLFTYVKGGYFNRGSNSGDADEKPVRKIKINDFFIGKYEVTNAEYCVFLNYLKPDAGLQRKYINIKGHYKEIKCRIYKKDSVYYTEQGYKNLPVIFVSWFGADAYCKFVGGRLLTEAEWEYAAKGGNISFLSKLFQNYLYSGSNKPGIVSWYRDNSENKPHRVGRKKANKANTFDMSGNAEEWCNDWYSPEYYSVSPADNPQGIETGRMKVHRGGSWYNTPEMLRITNRRASKPVTQNALIGFRIVKDVTGFSVKKN
ncbi:MAG: formylglycine-generating enzyme family protein [Chlorobi bacterium]|nr:formylglycine-generating enzyme family protein [Chlorobiota bacterium]